jgi:hypothetical protein
MALTARRALVNAGHMSFQHVGGTGPDAPGAGRQPDPVGDQVDWRASLRRADHACCCPAQPSVVVILPPAPGRPHPVDLLLCRHHYRRCARALAAAGAAVLGTDGVPLTDQPRPLVASRV